MVRFGRGAEKSACRNAGGAAADCQWRDGPRDDLRQGRARRIFLRSRDGRCRNEVYRSGRGRRVFDCRDVRAGLRDAVPRDSTGRENRAGDGQKFSAGARSRDVRRRRCGISWAGRKNRRGAAKDRASRGGRACGPSRGFLRSVRGDGAGSKGRETRACRAYALPCQNVFRLSTVTPGDRKNGRDQSAAVFCKLRRQILRARAEQTLEWRRKSIRAARKFFQARRLGCVRPAEPRRAEALPPSGAEKRLRRKRACDAAPARVFQVRCGRCARA